MSESGQPKEIELTEVEHGMMSDMISIMQNDIMNSMFIVIVKELFVGQKPFLQNIINQWAGNYFDVQMKTVTSVYNKLTEEQKKNAVPLERHIEIMGWCVNNVKLNWEQMLDLKKIIITN